MDAGMHVGLYNLHVYYMIIKRGRFVIFCNLLTLNYKDYCCMPFEMMRSLER